MLPDSDSPTSCAKHSPHRSTDARLDRRGTLGAAEFGQNVVGPRSNAIGDDHDPNDMCGDEEHNGPYE